MKYLLPKDSVIDRWNLVEVPEYPYWQHVLTTKDVYYTKQDIIPCVPTVSLSIHDALEVKWIIRVPSEDYPYILVNRADLIGDEASPDFTFTSTPVGAIATGQIRDATISSDQITSVLCKQCWHPLDIILDDFSVDVCNKCFESTVPKDTVFQRIMKKTFSILFYEIC